VEQETKNELSLGWFLYGFAQQNPLGFSGCVPGWLNPRELDTTKYITSHPCKTYSDPDWLSLLPSVAW